MRRLMSRLLALWCSFAAALCGVAERSYALDESQGWMSDGNALYITVGLGHEWYGDDPALAQFRHLRESAPMLSPMEETGSSHYVGDVGVFFVRAISFGFRYEYNSHDYFSAPPFLIFGPSRSSSTQSKDMMLDLRAWMPPRRGALLGVAVGLSKGQLEQEGSERWSGNAACYEFYTGGQLVKGGTNGLLLLARFGYALRDYGDTVNGYGEHAELNMSGWFVELSAGGIAQIRSLEQ